VLQSCVLLGNAALLITGVGLALLTAVLDADLDAPVHLLPQAPQLVAV
jgi:hypothetical protein